MHFPNGSKTAVMNERQKIIRLLLAVVILFSALRSWKVISVLEGLSTTPWYEWIPMVLCLPVAWVFAVIGAAQILLQRGNGILSLAISAALFLAGALIFGTVLSFVPYLIELLPISVLTPIVIGVLNLLLVYLMWSLGTVHGCGRAGD